MSPTFWDLRDSRIERELFCYLQFEKYLKASEEVNMHIFLKLKHWILLALMLIPPFVADIADLTGFWNIVCTEWLALIFTCWLFSIGNATYNRSSVSWFAVVLFKAGAIYSITYPLYFFYEVSDISKFFHPWPISLHIAAMIACLYLMFFAAKSLVRYEEEYDLDSKSIFLTFCAIWFFPIGIFFIQPRVNRIAGSESSMASAGR